MVWQQHPLLLSKSLLAWQLVPSQLPKFFFFINRIQTLPDAVGVFSFTSSLFDSLNPTYITFSLCRLGHVTSEILFWKINCRSWLICEFWKVEFDTEAPTVWLGSAVKQYLTVLSVLECLCCFYSWALGFSCCMIYWSDLTTFRTISFLFYQWIE